MVAVDPATLRWHYAFDERAPDFVLERALGDEAEGIGRVRREQYHGDRSGWAWSINATACCRWTNDPDAGTWIRSGFEETKREACAALLAAWAKEAAWRAGMREKMLTNPEGWNDYQVRHVFRLIYDPLPAPVDGEKPRPTGAGGREKRGSRPTLGQAQRHGLFPASRVGRLGLGAGAGL